MEKKGTEFTYTFDNGSKLWVDPEKKKYRLEEGGVRYDGFTPFNNKDVMAIIRRGDFSSIPFKVVLYDKNDKMEWGDATPVLMLRRVAQQGAAK